MSYTIADLRKSRGDFSAITKALEKTNGYDDDDADFFKVQRDKAGNGSAVLRFLPKHPGDDLPWVQMYSHSFQGPTGRWYIENCRTTLGEEDPVASAARELWATGLEKDKEVARKYKRKLSYIANVYVVSAPGQPELEGTIRRFKFGKKIFEKIMDKAKPTFEDEKPLNVFDPFEGADFKLRMRQVDGFPNYDTSVFSEPKPIAESDDEILAILNQMKPLKELVDPSKFKSFDELDKKFKSVINGNVAPSGNAEAVLEKMRAEPTKEAPALKSKEAPKVADSSDEDDMEAYFKKIAEGE